jgi:predicted DCC family thiol-disulfide oxidoreductase YuxK
MSRPGPARPEPLLIFDGDCGLCRASVDWALARSRTPLRAVAWQALGPRELAVRGLAVGDVQRAVYLVLEDGRLLRGHEAAAAVLQVCGPLWGLLGRLLALPGISRLSRLVYEAVAVNRHRLRVPGQAACPAPSRGD